MPSQYLAEDTITWRVWLSDCENRQRLRSDTDAANRRIPPHDQAKTSQGYTLTESDWVADAEIACAARWIACCIRL